MQRQVMALHLKPRWRQLGHRARAGVDGEHAVAARAVEMVVMVVRVRAVVVRTGGFVARRLPRQVDPRHDAQLLQRVELPVDSREVEGRHLLLRQFAQLGGGQGAGAALQGLQERVALAGLAFAGFHVAHANAKAFATTVGRKKPRGGQAGSGSAAGLSTAPLRTN